MNKFLIEKRFRKGLPTYDEQADAQTWAARSIADRVSTLFPKGCTKLLEIGCGTGILTEKMVQQTPIKELYLNDIVRESEVVVTDKLVSVPANNYLKPSSGHAPDIHFLHGDAEIISFPPLLDAVVSTSTIQWFNDLPAFFIKAYQSLKPGGWFCASTFGPNNLLEINQLTGIGLSYPDAHTLSKWLECRFTKVQMNEHELILAFDSPKEVLKHLKHTGVTGIKERTWTPSTLRTFENNYRAHFQTGEKVSLTYQIILLQAQKPLLT